MSKNPQAHGVRADIQALRSLAIVAVLIFHVWPELLPGGFVGVDIFFVISGFLITGHLYRQVHRHGRVDFKDFWARRARRLLPASMLAIAVTSVATYFLTTASWFIKIKDEAYGSIFYVQNWVLVDKLTDYLRNDGTESPFQHFWSLSVEEQYYIFWPILLFLVLLVTRYSPARLRAKLAHKNVLLGLLTIMLIASLAYSIWLTRQQPDNAYFNTFTRAWEFAAGAILAIATDGHSERAAKRSPIWYWAGVVLMFVAIVGFTTETPFPSYWAAIPVAGAVLALHGGQSGSRLMPRGFLGWRTNQFLGDISYSLYLWHWPVLVLAPWVLGRELDVFAKLIVVAISVLLGWLSKRYVEDPVRFGPLSKLPVGRQLVASVLAMVLIFGGTWALGKVAKFTLDNNASNTQLTPPLNDLNNGAKAAESGNCKVAKESDGWLTCQKGNPRGKLRVALIGDSHTRQYFVPVDDLAFKYNWNLTMISKSACTVLDPELYPKDLTHFTCEGWNQKLVEYLDSQEPFDLIINSNSSLVTQGRSDVAKAYRSLVEKQTKRGTVWLTIHDNPKPNTKFISCIETWGTAAGLKCAYPRSEALKPADPTAPAVKDLPGVIYADPTDKFCNATSCPPVIGNIIVYRDNSHITTTWAKALQPWLEAQIPAEFKQ